MHTIKITPNLLFKYQCRSGKFIRLPNRIESKLFCLNWNALLRVSNSTFLKTNLRARFCIRRHPTKLNQLGNHYDDQLNETRDVFDRSNPQN